MILLIHYSFDRGMDMRSIDTPLIISYTTIKIYGWIGAIYKKLRQEAPASEPL
jgi:hypothetical protein